MERDLNNFLIFDLQLQKCSFLFEIKNRKSFWVYFKLSQERLTASSPAGLDAVNLSCDNLKYTHHFNVCQQFSPKIFLLIYSVLSNLGKNIFPAIFAGNLRQ